MVLFHVSVQLNESLHLPKHHDYYQQIQGQMYLTNTKCADLLVWTPHDAQIIRIVKDNDWARNIHEMIAFYFTTYLELADEAK